MMTSSSSLSPKTLSFAPARWLSVVHETRYDYAPPVELGHHLGWLLPRSTPRQQVRGWQLHISPAPDEWLQAGVGESGPVPPGQLHEDVFGNRWLAFSHSRRHEQLRVTSRFEAGVGWVPGLSPQLSPAWSQVAEGLRYHAGATRSEAVEFSLASPCVPLSPALAAFGREAFNTPDVPLLAGAQRLMKLVHQRISYVPGSTTVYTRAPEALAGGQGVCQDLAHVMMGALRALGLSARYVSGYLLTLPPPGMPKLVGADASHAWVEVWCPLHGWVALDPTNDLVVGPDHVTLAWGRDYADVAPLRGMINGGARAEPLVSVNVEACG